jgi:UDP-N-acetylglucosamine--N-acetylmuramyl-(pentapeptide) pyrophosphoryl-undecaprenol N-acetylglucosamine transferase
LVPYPHAWRYQKVNADYLAKRGAARILADEYLEQQLVPVVLSLLADPAGLDAMSQAMQNLASPQAAGSIARELAVLGTRAGGRE